MPQFDSIPPPTAGQATERALDALARWRLSRDPSDGELALAACREAARSELRHLGEVVGAEYWLG